MTTAFFEELVTPTSRLITCEDPPDLTELDPGDMVICADGWGIEEYTANAAERGIHVRYGAHRYQHERVVPKTAKRKVVIRAYTPLSGHEGETAPHTERAAVDQAIDAFAATWDALTTQLDHDPHFEPAADHVPADWLPYLPFPTLNPAQAETAPAIVGSHKSVVVTAPTGAGKTVIGMMAALKAIRRGRKAAWLVPQRSLTAELDRELDTWRTQGLRVVALSGEAVTDIEATKAADLWVATTEKFESLCRAASMREAIAEIDTIVVDEIHLLGDPSRGAVLETLLARVGAERLPVRIIGLSATAANAPAVADWLGADLVPINWRPTRQTQQMLMVPPDTAAAAAHNRDRVCANIVSDITCDGGSTIIFCGTKAKVRSTALAIARARGVLVGGIDPSDIAAVHEATQQAGVGLHYSDWPHKKEAERAFRDHESDVLVATSTLAAGVNLPARAVIVHDTAIGPSMMEVSMVQQMFGRAGRAGKEPEGWAFLIVDPNEIWHWRATLAAGYAIRSRIVRNLADHLLAEIVQGNIVTRDAAEQWWRHTFAHHEGHRGTADLDRAHDTLAKFGFIETNDNGVRCTRLGRITSRMMVAVFDACGIIASLNSKDTPTPNTANHAEDILIRILTARATSLSEAPTATGEQALKVRRILGNRGNTPRRGSTEPSIQGHLVSEAGLTLALHSPQAFAERGGQVRGINRALFNPALYDSPRLFAWLAAIGPLKAVPPWASVIGLDMGARVTWVNLAPRRGDGRLLAACERAVPRTRAATLVPELFRGARNTGVRAPHNLHRVGVAGIDPGKLHEVASHSATARVMTAPKGAATFAVDGNERKWVQLKPGEPVGDRMAAVFDPSGDSAGTGWMDGSH